MADRTPTATSYRTSDTSSQDSTFQAEHFLAYLFALLAIGMGVIGLLVGFDIIASGEENAALDGNAGSNFWDALLWLIPATSSAMLSYALHQTDHHRSRSPETLSDSQKSMWNAEHWLSYLTALAAIAFGALALLIGFDVFDNGNTVFDGVLWAWASLGSSVLTNTLHTVRHHQMATDEDYILGVVERHGVASRTTTTGVREPGMERRS